ncbi:hypothetical protein GOODEAATRI_012526 [Goodea atripinnis]|uniref:TGF-beta propeptide domain-containing protein n=1 Tax=Goodea atripinnis TaxID=208336 RepID=A0ABV0PDM1_9TELE
MFFNIADIRNSVGDFHLLTSAELRMLINTANINNEQRVELYYSSGASFRYHTTRFMTNSLKDKWLSFDVTEPLQQWLKDKGISTKRGDQGRMDLMTGQPPYILTISIPKNMSSHLTSRKKRSTSSPETCTA